MSLVLGPSEENTALFNGVNVNLRTPFSIGGDVAVSTGAAATELKAAVSGKRHWVTSWTVTNIKAGEYPIAILQDDAGTPVKHCHITPEQPVATAMGSITRDFSKGPVLIASGKAIDYLLQTATGDTHSMITGWTEN